MRVLLFRCLTANADAQPQHKEPTQSYKIEKPQAPRRGASVKRRDPCKMARWLCQPRLPTQLHDPRKGVQRDEIPLAGSRGSAPRVSLTIRIGGFSHENPHAMD